MGVMPCRVISVGIARPFESTNAFLSDPANMALWAAGLGDGLARGADGVWRAMTGMGEVTIAFAPPNAFGVADHTLTAPDGTAFFNPMRAAPNGDGCEVSFWLYRRAGASDDEYEADAAAVAADLATLKALLEKPA